MIFSVPLSVSYVLMNLDEDNCTDISGSFDLKPPSLTRSPHTMINALHDVDLNHILLNQIVMNSIQ